ncbi:MAG: VOC family protein [Acidimicrobiia bacterium]|jgi:hypothetical protein
MRIQVNIDCSDKDLLSTFWCAALGYEPKGSLGQYASITDPTGSGPDLVFQEVDEPKSTKNRMHLDLYFDDIESERARLIELGALASSEDAFEMKRERWFVMTDPEGNEFCICRR